MIDISVREVDHCGFDADFEEMDLDMIGGRKCRIDCEVVEIERVKLLVKDAKRRHSR